MIGGNRFNTGGGCCAVLIEFVSHDRPGGICDILYLDTGRRTRDIVGRHTGFCHLCGTSPGGASTFLGLLLFDCHFKALSFKTLSVNHSLFTHVSLTMFTGIVKVLLPESTIHFAGRPMAYHQAMSHCAYVGFSLHIWFG